MKWRKKSGPTAQRSYGVDVVSDVLPFGRLWYGETNAVSNAIDYAKFFGCSHDAVIRVYDDPGNVIETHEDKGDTSNPLASAGTYRTEARNGGSQGRTNRRFSTV